MTVSPSSPTTDARAPAEPATARQPSEYAALMPLLEELAALDSADPRRAALRDEVITAFLPLVDRVARSQARGRADTLEELIQVGRLALVKAVDAWDPELAHGEFIGYAIPCIRGEMLRWFRDHTWALRVPRRIKEVSGHITRAVEPLSQRLGRAPRPSELARHLDLSVEEVIEALGAQAGHDTVALDAPDPSTDAPVDRVGDLDPALENIESRHAIRPLIAALPERERRILALRFFAEKTQTQIADELGISQMHVSRLLARTLDQLRTQLAASEAEDASGGDGRRGDQLPRGHRSGDAAHCPDPPTVTA
jgi:RNA polymerase sigma-B factor